MSSARIPVVGIIGGIGSGKTALAMALAEYVSVCRLDADGIGHLVLQMDSVKSQLASEWGTEIFDSSGEIVRSRIAELVFGDDEAQQNRRKFLESIVHPEIRVLIKRRLEEFQDQANCDVILMDAALLLEGGWDSVCDAVIYLEVPEEIRLRRVAKRGWTEEQFRKREASQMPLAEKQKRADVTIPNDGDINTAAQKLANWLQNRHLITSPITECS